MIDHDQLFKKLISTFFTEFIELFLPQVAEYLERDSITFLEKEFFTDIPTGDRRQLDLLAKVKYRGQDTCFLVHIEHQSTSETNFAQRMFRYFSYIHQKHGSSKVKLSVRRRAGILPVTKQCNRQDACPTDLINNLPHLLIACLSYCRFFLR